MGIHCGLRDKFGSVVKNEAFIFQLEALFQTVFNGLGPDPEASFPEWRVLQENIQQLAMLHRQEVELDQALAEALSTQSYMLETRKLLLDLLATTPAALLQAHAVPAGAVHAVDAALWLRWWRDPQSWMASCSFQQWCKDKPVLESSKKASTTARKLTGPQPANVAQAVVWRLQARKITTENCDAANDAVRTLQSKLADMQRQQEEAYAQLQQGWQKVLSSAFAPQQPIQAMQQELAASQAQLAAAVQEVAAARARAEAAETELQQVWQQQPLAVTLAVQQPSIVLQIKVQGPSDRAGNQPGHGRQHDSQVQKNQQGQRHGQEAVSPDLLIPVHATEQQLEANKQSATEAALAAMLLVQQQEERQWNEHHVEQQPDTPQEWQQQGLPAPALRLLDNTPCVSSSSSSGSTSHRPNNQGGVQQESAGDHAQVQCASLSAAGQQSQQGSSDTADTAQSVGDCEAHASTVGALVDQGMGTLLGQQGHQSHSPCGSVNSSTRRPKFVKDSDSRSGWAAEQDVRELQQQQTQQSPEKAAEQLNRDMGGVHGNAPSRDSSRVKSSSSRGSIARACSDTASSKVVAEMKKSQSDGRNQTADAVKRPLVAPPPPVWGVDGSAAFMPALHRQRDGLDWLQILQKNRFSQ